MHIIVGIDPGTTVGIAAVDLTGNVVKVISKKNAERRDVVRMIERMGTPVLVACDKRVAPEYVVKIAASFNARLYVPGHDLTVSEKEKLTKEYDVKDDHQRDALAAALKAYHVYENKFRQIDSLTYSKDTKERMKVLVVSGTRMSDALITAPEHVKAEEVKIKRKTVKREKTLTEYIERIQRLIDESNELRKALERERMKSKRLEEQVIKIKQERMREVYRDREIKRLKAEIRRLRKLIGELVKKKRNTHNRKTGSTKEKGKGDGEDLKRLLDKIIDNYRRKRQTKLS
ncbi:DUF460 domain-containing protein [Candidatus Micrarchaeota archaeon]|nr:DUF460 domain-containing protein [Candidatus Micrarchaeota archaeon]